MQEQSQLIKRGASGKLRHATPVFTRVKPAVFTGLHLIAIVAFVMLGLGLAGFGGN